MAENFNVGALSGSTEYESYLLEAVYSIANQPLVTGRPDELTYSLTTDSPHFTRFASINVNLGDWRPGFIKAGAPLIFTTAFKLLDMLVEWILLSNGQKPDYKFMRKMSQLKRPLALPSQMQTRPWFFESIVSLYTELAPLRGTVIHQRHFKSEDGNLFVSASKGGTTGEAVPISADELRTLSQVVVTAVRFLEGTWEMDEFGGKLLASCLDTLARLHKLPMTGQRTPILLKVRLFRKVGDDLLIDVDKIRRDADQNSPGSESMFDVEAIVLVSTESKLAAYRLPWRLFRDGTHSYSASRTTLEQYAMPIPDDINEQETIKALRARPS